MTTSEGLSWWEKVRFFIRVRQRLRAGIGRLPDGWFQILQTAVAAGVAPDVTDPWTLAAGVRAHSGGETLLYRIHTLAQRGAYGLQEGTHGPAVEWKVSLFR